MPSGLYDVTVYYTTPVPPGFTAEKQRVKIADGIPYAEVAATVEHIRVMMDDLKAVFTDADPYKGWAPFVFGFSVAPHGWGI